jgi:long-subunit fatty acid transport protein
MKGLFFIAILIFTSISAFSQKTVERQELLWLKYSVDYQVNEKWSLNYYIEDRNFIKDFRSNHFLNAISAKRKLKNNWTFGAGYLYFILTLPQDPEEEVWFTRQEHRPFQSISLTQKLGEKLTFGLRYQVEQRFRRNSNADGRLAGHNMELMFRQKASLKYAITDKLDAILYDEVMIHFGENVTTNTFDQNRLSLGLDWQMMEKFKRGLSYVHWYQQRGASESYYQRNITSLVLSHLLN